MNKSFNGKKLSDIRVFRKYTLTELSEITGISRQTLSLYEDENKKIKPEAQNLLKLADALKVPLEYFYIDNAKKYSDEATYFRSLLTSSKKDKASEIKRMEYLGVIFEFLDDWVTFPTLDIPQIDIEEFKINHPDEDVYDLIAKNVREHWGMDLLKPIEDLKYLLEEKGIYVVSSKESCEKVDAFSQRLCINGRYNYLIALNDNQSYCRVMFDMAHELGHILLHPWTENLELIEKDDFRNREDQANNFAAAFLMPKEGIIKDLQFRDLRLDYFLSLKQKWNVSAQALIRRAFDLSYLNRNQYEYLLRQISKNGYRKKEPFDYLYQINDTLISKSIELCIKYNQFSFSDFISSIYSKGFVFYKEEVVAMLGLDAKLLENNDNSKFIVFDKKLS